MPTLAAAPPTLGLIAPARSAPPPDTVAAVAVAPRRNGLAPWFAHPWIAAALGGVALAALGIVAVGAFARARPTDPSRRDPAPMAPPIAAAALPPECEAFIAQQTCVFTKLGNPSQGEPLRGQLERVAAVPAARRNLVDMCKQQHAAVAERQEAKGCP